MIQPEKPPFWDNSGEANWDAARRPYAGSAYRRLLEEMATANPALFPNVDGHHLLVVVGAARGEASASIRGLAPNARMTSSFEKPQVVINGLVIRYEICLRPKYFLETSPDERAEIVAHELWHTAISFDGTLDDTRRHKNVSMKEAVEVAREIATNWRKRASSFTLQALSHRGELRLPAWSSRPPSLIPRGSSARRRFGDSDLFWAIVEQR